jgi:uncharacterized protein (TIGR04255 family)
VNLKKPPIVEMWVEFSFEPNPNRSVEPARRFLAEFAGQYPKAEVAQQDTLQFRHVSPTQLPEVVGREVAISHVRISDEPGTRWIHLTPNHLVCNFLRLGDSYPGFKALSEDAVSKLKRFVEVCQPVRIRHAAVHYVDVIDIPLPPAREILLSDYFTLGLDLPSNPFGNQLSYLLRTAVKPGDGTGVLEIQLQNELRGGDAPNLRFRMDWHKLCTYDKEVDPDRIPADLAAAHASVMRCFRAAFTERTWALFEPEG